MSCFTGKYSTGIKSPQSPPLRYGFFLESFKTNYNADTIVLMGDSILKNNAYVATGSAVDEILTESTNATIISLATNNSIIADVYNQISKIDYLKCNNSSCCIFLSIGGNDILYDFLKHTQTFTHHTNRINIIFEEYAKLVNTILAVIPDARMYLLNLYVPYDPSYTKYKKDILEWNRLLDNFVSSSLQINGIINVYANLNSIDDFTHHIEPSKQGSKKIVSLIKNM
jgi:hypothetical protein